MRREIMTSCSSPRLHASDQLTSRMMLLIEPKGVHPLAQAGQISRFVVQFAVNTVVRRQRSLVGQFLQVTHVLSIASLPVGQCTHLLVLVESWSLDSRHDYRHITNICQQEIAQMPQFLCKWAQNLTCQENQVS